MQASEHARIALAWLTVSDEEFAEGRRMQASEKLWGAAAHAILAVIMERGWRHGGHRDLVVTVNRLAEESGSEILHEEFDAARQFHANFYQNFLDNDEITENRSQVHQFVTHGAEFSGYKPRRLGNKQHLLNGGKPDMSISVRIPTPLRRVTDGADKVDADGATLEEIIGSLESQYPGIKARLCDEEGELRNFVNVYINGEDVRFMDGLGTATKTGDEVSIVPAVAGGS